MTARWAVLLAACGQASIPLTSKAPMVSMTLPASAQVGVVSVDGRTYAFDSGAVTIMQGTSTIARVPAPLVDGNATEWTSPTSLRGPDGQQWVVGIAGGLLWRVTSSGDLERAGRRLGIGDSEVLAVDGTAMGFAISFSGGIAVSQDGVGVTTFKGADAKLVALARDRIAIGRRDAVEVLALARHERIRYAIPGASSIRFTDAMSARPNLVVAARGRVYVEAPHGLQRVADDALRISVAGPRVWISRHDGNLVFDVYSHKLERLTVPPGTLYAGPSPDEMWVAGASTLVRYSLGGLEPARWNDLVAPIFVRVCANCHRTGGSANLDLSTWHAWQVHAADISHVLATGQMPPERNDLSEDDRSRLMRWLHGERMPADSAGTADPAVR